MTDAQKFHFYFPAWTRCAKANDWRMQKGRIVAEPKNHPEELARVWTYARQIADLEQRGIKPDDLRHACHIVALDCDKSSAHLDNKEVNRVVALFDYLADPDDLGAVTRWMNPEIGERESLVIAIKKKAHDAYVAKISESRFKTKSWEDLQLWQLKKLFGLLTQRNPKRNFQPRRPAPEPEVDPENVPF